MKGSIIKLRAIEKCDIDLLYQWENNTNIWKVSNTIQPWSQYVLSQYLEQAHLDIYSAKQIRFVIETIDKNIPVGLIDLFDFDPHHKRVGLGIMIANEKDYNKGYAYESIKLVIDYCFKILFLKQVFCNISSDNEKSINLFKKAGFELIGTKKQWNKVDFNKWNDELMFQFINQDII